MGFAVFCNPHRSQISKTVFGNSAIQPTQQIRRRGGVPPQSTSHQRFRYSPPMTIARYRARVNKLKFEDFKQPCPVVLDQNHIATGDKRYFPSENPKM
jgi:hypothetical protein